MSEDKRTVIDWSYPEDLLTLLAFAQSRKKMPPKVGAKPVYFRSGPRGEWQHKGWLMPEVKRKCKDGIHIMSMADDAVCDICGEPRPKGYFDL